MKGATVVDKSSESTGGTQRRLARRLFVHATNVHQGGGRSLLAGIVGVLPGAMTSMLSLDSRMVLPEALAGDIHVRRVAPSIAQRFMAEKWLAGTVVPGDIVLCFGNLPPLFRLRGHVVVFVQNRYLVDDVPLAGFSWKTRLRLTMERLWLSGRMNNADEFVVQTPSMKRLLDAKTKGSVPVRVSPFIASHDDAAPTGSPLDVRKEESFDFLYVASGEAHKNHRQLIEAWCLLAGEGLFPSLKLTLDASQCTELCAWLEGKIGQCGLQVENLGSLPHGAVRQLYGQASALIYPSHFESFGLPLIEARQAGLPVLAPELDYVRDITDPEQTFDPASPVSIARAVKRFLGLAQPPLPLEDARGFMQHVLQSGK